MGMHVVSGIAPRSTTATITRRRVVEMSGYSCTRTLRVSVSVCPWEDCLMTRRTDVGIFSSKRCLSATRHGSRSRQRDHDMKDETPREPNTPQELGSPNPHATNPILERILEEVLATRAEQTQLRENQEKFQKGLVELQQGQAELRGSVAELQKGQAELRGNVAELQKG